MINTAIKQPNLVDYMIGVEAGLDSNGRKNRGGHAMENIVEVFIKDVCEKNNFRYLKEVNADKIKSELGYDVPVDKSSRRYDFVIDNGKELFIIETNFYGGGGSKPSEIIGRAYPEVQTNLQQKGIGFVVITDGVGWNSMQPVIKTAFDKLTHLMNINQARDGELERVILDIVQQKS